MTGIATTSATEAEAPAVRAANAIMKPIVTRAMCSQRTSTCHAAVSAGPVRERDRVYDIDSTESRMLATVGAFRVVAESDLHDGRDDTRKAQHHLEQAGCYVRLQSVLTTAPLS